MDELGVREMHVMAVGRSWTGRSDDVARALAGLRGDGMEVLKREGGDSVLAGMVLGRAVVIKIAGPRGILGTIKRYLGMSRHWRQWRGAGVLGRLGVLTAEPLALCAELGTGRDWLVIERLIGPTLLDVLSGRAALVDEAGLQDLAREVGRQAARLVTGGHFNRDHKPSNIIVTADGPAIIDTVAIRRCGEKSELALARMLASLLIEPTGCGFPPGVGLRARCIRGAIEVMAEPGQRRETRRRVWALVRELFDDHGDMRPAVDPLAGSGAKTGDGPP